MKQFLSIILLFVLLVVSGCSDVKSPLDTTSDKNNADVPLQGSEKIQINTNDSRNDPPNLPEIVTPPDNATGIPITINLAWTCTDPDGDPLTYDVYFGETISVSLVSEGQTETIYDPETLDNFTTYYWKIVAYDNNTFTVGDIWTYTTVGIGDFEWCLVPAGEFTFGEDDQLIVLDYNYEIMKYHVTNNEYRLFLQEAYSEGLISVSSTSVEGNYPGDEKIDAGIYEFLDIDGEDCRINWNGSTFNIDAGFNDHPVVQVTWFGAWAFANYYGLDLPTEIEWEKAALGESGSDYAWGDDMIGPPGYDRIANLRFWEDYGWSTPTLPVGSFNGQTLYDINGSPCQTYDNSSPYGLYDMTGNVWCWTSDWWSDASHYRARRGGSWKTMWNLGTTWNRLGKHPTSSFSDIGFRCVYRTN